MAVIATDGELYGHHQKFRDLFLARLVNPGPDVPDRGFDVTTVGQVVGGTPACCLPADPDRRADLVELPPRRAALDGRMPGRRRRPLEGAAARGPRAARFGDRRGRRESGGGFHGSGALWRARDEYVDVIFGAETPEGFAQPLDAPRPRPEQRERFLVLLEAERWRLAMFASDGWFWGDPIRLETKHVLLCAARAARLIDGAAGTDLEGRLVDDLSLFTSPSRRIDGSAIYPEALSDAGQPPG